MIDNIFRIRDIVKELKLAEPNLDSASVFRILCESAKQYPKREDIEPISEPEVYRPMIDETIRDRVLTLAKRNGIKLDCDALDIPEGVKPFTLGVVLPSDFDIPTREFERAFELAARSLGVDVRVIFRYIPNTFGGRVSCSSETLYAILNSLRVEHTDVYVLATLDSPAFLECLNTLCERKPVMIFDGVNSMSDYDALGDCAFVLPDYYRLGQIAALAIDDIVSSTDFIALVTSDKNDKRSSGEKSPLISGYIKGIERLTALNKPDVAMFYTDKSIHRTPEHLASSYGNYYGFRRGELNRLAIENRTQNHGLGVLFANHGDLAVAIDAMINLDSTFDRFIGNTAFVGVGDDLRSIPYKLTERIKVYISVDLHDRCCLTIASAARRLALGKFERRQYYPKCILTKKYSKSANT